MSPYSQIHIFVVCTTTLLFSKACTLLYKWTAKVHKTFSVFIRKYCRVNMPWAWILGLDLFVHLVYNVHKDTLPLTMSILRLHTKTIRKQMYLYFLVSHMYICIHTHLFCPGYLLFSPVFLFSIVSCLNSPPKKHITSVRKIYFILFVLFSFWFLNNYLMLKKAVLFEIQKNCTAVKYYCN